MKQAINTRTQEEYDALMKWRKENGCEYPHVSYFHHNGYSTCVLVGIPFLFASVAFYKSKGYTIIPYTEFAKANIEPDYKALYLEGREFVKILESDIRKLLIMCDYPAEDRRYYTDKIKAFLTKHNDLTNHKDGE